MARITPAYAGKRQTVISSDVAKRDHPRLCGEKSSSCMTAPLMSGSPPPMRGKVLKQQSLLLMKRITPAYAGKSGYTRQRTSGRWDHPRLCGEKKYKETKEQWQAGSPPPMRGKDNKKTNTHITLRITPAYAGKRGHLMK